MNQIAKLNPKDCWHRMQQNPGSLLIDVRDPLEYRLIGHPTGSVNVPWKTLPGWQPNPHFLEQVKQLAPELDRPLFLLCRSGQRSLEAAQALAASGYRDLTNVEQGFEGPLDADQHRGTIGGWRYHGLPWQQS